VQASKPEAMAIPTLGHHGSEGIHSGISTAYAATGKWYSKHIYNSIPSGDTGKENEQKL
jgi:hypothetical protein